MKWNSPKMLAVIVAQSLAILCPSVANAQGPIASGETRTGTISSAGDFDSWTFSANAGDSIVLRVGEITQTGAFNPRIRLFNPSGALLATTSSVVAAEIAVTAASSGTFTVIVDDAVGTTATGTYRLTLAKTGDPVVVTPGDEGGLLTNGLMYTGTIDVGDLEVWSVTASAGESIVVSMGEVTSGSSLWPSIRIYGPSGALLGSNYGSGAVGMTVTAPSSGSFLVVVGDGSSGYGGSGAYRLTMAQTGSAVAVSPGDEGGLLTNGLTYTGTIDVGDLDVWSVTASAGESIVVSMGEVTSGSSLSPWVRIYSPSGPLLGSNSGSAAAEVAVRAASSGSFLVVVGDGSPGSGGSGAYRLTMGQTGSAVEVSPGDEGGLLTNGVSTGTIDVGDLDVWSATVNSGNNIVVHMDEVTSGSSLSPWVRIYGPSGALLGGNSGSAATEVAVTAPSSGSILVVVGDGSSGYGGSGPYRLTVSGILPPIAICHNSTNILTSGCTTNVPAADVDNGSFDPDGTIVSETLSPPGPYGLGNTPVTLRVVDNSGMTGTCNAVITVLDLLRPTITCPADITVPAAPGSCSSIVGFSIVASDNCGISNVVATPASGSSFAVGTTVVNVIAADTSGNTTTCSFSVTVNDAQLPTVSCPANITVPAAPDSCSSNVSFSIVASDNCGISSVVATPASGSSFAVGTTMVNVTATDTSGNTTTCSFSVTVNDAQLPTESCPANITVPAAPDSCSSNVSFSIVASDNCGISNVVATPASGSSFAVGTTMVNVTATDTSGNTTTCSFSVTVNDAQLPTVSCPANVTTNVPQGVTGAVITFPSATAGDNCPGVTAVCHPPSGSVFPLGANTVVWTAVDASGNSNTCSFLVNVFTILAPLAGFTASPTAGAVPLTVSFIDTSAGTVTNRVWSFGDGGSSALANVIHSYNAPGVYSVSLSVFGPGGLDTATRNSLITVTNSVPQFTSPPTVTNTLGTVDKVVLVKPNEAIGFSVGAYDVDGNPVSCLWNFGDGSANVDCNPSHVFSNCGPHDVSVTIGDGFASMTTGMTVAVTCPMGVSSLKLQAKFKRAGSDTCAINGTLNGLPVDFSITNAAVELDVGGTTVDFQLNAKGRGVNGNGNIKFAYNKKTRVWRFTGKLKGDLNASWAKYGITSGISINANVTFPVLLILQSDTLESFDAELPLNYRNRSGTSGTAKYVPIK